MSTFNERGAIILDNGGGITLQLGEFVHYYDSAEQVAEDIANWLADADTSGWEGHEHDHVEPSDEMIRNGGYRVVRLDRELDTLATLADEVAEIDVWGNAAALAAALRNSLPTGS